MKILKKIIIECNAYSVAEVDDGILSLDEEKEKNLDKLVKKEIKKANENIKKNNNEDDFDEQDENNNYNHEHNLIEEERSNKNLILNMNMKNHNDPLHDSKTKELINSISDNTNDQSNYKGINKNEYSVRIKNMQKIYNNGCNICSKPTLGVKNISFTVNYGECFGLLGLNGAGKTTIFKAITEEHSPTHGSIYINGLNLTQNFDKVKLMFGYCPQFDAIFPYMTVYENLEFYSRIKGVAPEKLKEVIQAMIESMTLTKYTKKLAGRLSGGNKRKLSVAISMICNPPVVLLDEPSTGMDPEARRFMWAVIHKLTSKSDSNSVIMTTHAMDEAETLCRRMGIMVNGEFVCLGTSNYIKETYGYGYEIDIRIKPLEQEKLNLILEELGMKRNHKIKTMDEVKEILSKIKKEHFCKYIENTKFQLLYQATRDGDKISDMEQKIKEYSPTLFLLYTKKGIKCGGYTKALWKMDSEYKYDSSSFLYNFSTRKIITIKNPKEAIICDGYAACFGNKNNSDYYIRNSFFNSGVYYFKFIN